MVLHTNSEVFDNIYTSNKWIFGSGTGSVAFFNKPYISFLNTFLEEHPDIHTIVDIGCGDWQIGRHIQLGERTYIGCDVSNIIVNKSREKFGTDKITFVHLDAVTEELPKGDLVIIKDVLQHLPTHSAQGIIEKLDAYKYVIMQNDIFPDQEGNKDIKSGDFRPLDVTEEPFNKKEYFLVKEYTEGLRKPLNIVRKLIGQRPIKKGIFVKKS